MRRAALLTLALLALPPAFLRAQEAGKLEQPEKQEELLRRADSLAAEGNVSLYREWLLANSEAEAFGEVLLRAVEAAAEVGDALRLLAEFSPRLREPAAREACLERWAALLRLAGRLEEALAVLAGLPDTPARLLERSRLSIEMGLASEAEKLLQRARASEDAETEPAARLLLATVYLASGREAQGEAELRGLVESHPDAPVVPAALLALGETLRNRGQTQAAEEVLRELEARFPASPEAALARVGKGVRRASVPLRLLPPEGPVAARLSGPAEPGNPPGSGPPPPPRLALVQAGSFRDPENAKYLARDLAARGFEARVVEKAVGDSRYYRVVVGQQQSPERAQELILKLKDAGYEAVLLLE